MYAGTERKPLTPREATVIFNALACDRRRAVLYCLRRGITRPIDIAAEIGISPPTVIHHLRILREAGLADVYPRAGQSNVDVETLEALMSFICNKYR